jgi:tetratricopeptide (TPR) repeat protein
VKNKPKKVVPIIIVFVVLTLAVFILLRIYPLRQLSLGDNLFVTHEINTRLLFNEPPKSFTRDLVQACEQPRNYQPIIIDYPFDNSIFPPEIVAPTFLWHDSHQASNLWLIDVTFTDNPNHIYILAEGKAPEYPIDPQAVSESNKDFEPSQYQRSAKSWTPDKRTWNIIKHNSIQRPATVTIFGFSGDNFSVPLSKASLTILTSKDPVAAPIFYRDVPLMPSITKEGTIKPIAKDALPLISWKLRDISKPSGKTVLTDMPTCANCHTFSADGKTLGMDLDGPDGDKGAYAFTPVKKKIKVTYDDIITWNSYEPKDPPGHKSFGLFSNVSPDGRFVVTTVNESVFVANYQNFEFLQSFYPTRGIFAVYYKRTAAMKALPGADNPNYVHTNACWSHDGKYLLFSRAPAKDDYEHKELPKYAGHPKETFIQYDLYRMPFNDGEGGIPQPVEGASNNGMSNSFPRYSPDGKWIIFVKSEKGQLMRPDSRLFIVPAEGGTARELACNLPVMNSWHSFSPTGRWLVFASKGLSVFTQMFLTHIDEDGNASAPILVPNSTAANRAVNIPEFVNNKQDAIASINTPTQQAYRYAKEGDRFMEGGAYDKAIKKYNKSLKLNPYFNRAYLNLGVIAAAKGQSNKAIMHYRKAIEIDSDDVMARCNLGLVLIQQRRYEQAITQFALAELADPTYGDIYLGWATALEKQRKHDEALAYYKKAFELHKNKQRVITAMLPFIMERFSSFYLQNDIDVAEQWFTEAVAVKKDDPAILIQYAVFLNKTGRAKAAIAQYHKALELDPNEIGALDSLAWLLATHPDKKIRDGRKAVELAERACRLTEYMEPIFLDCLAVAYAESGQFREALRTARNAIVYANSLNLPELEQKIKAHVELFKNNKPCREDPVEAIKTILERKSLL